MAATTGNAGCGGGFKPREMRFGSLASSVLLVLVGVLLGYGLYRRPAPPAPAPRPAPAADTSPARGAYLVTLGGCDDCHTPQLPTGEPDMTRRFAGHPAGTPAPAGLAGTVTWRNLIWRGPWGLSIASNITPDPEHGIGQWTAQQFIQTMRTGANPSGHKLLPPMPTAALGQLPDADLTAIYNFLKTVPASGNDAGKL